MATIRPQALTVLPSSNEAVSSASVPVHDPSAGADGFAFFERGGQFGQCAGALKRGTEGGIASSFEKLHIFNALTAVFSILHSTLWTAAGCHSFQSLLSPVKASLQSRVPPPCFHLRSKLRVKSAGKPAHSYQ